MSANSVNKDERLEAIRRANKKLIVRTFTVLGAIVLLFAAWIGTVQLITWYQQRPKPVLTEIPGYYKESEVMNFIATGMPFQAVIDRFGQPNSSLNGRDGTTHYFWHAPEGDRRYRFDFVFSGFTVTEKDGKVVEGSPTHRSTN